MGGSCCIWKRSALKRTIEDRQVRCRGGVWRCRRGWRLFLRRRGADGGCAADRSAGFPRGSRCRTGSAPRRASSESICRSSGSASSRGVSEPREKDVSSRADVSASSSCTCSQQRQHELHRTDLPQRTARLFRRAAGTAGEADVIARVHDHDETERTGALENAQVFGVVQIDLLIGRVDLDAAHVGRGEAVELLLPVFVIRVDAAEGEHICDERVFVVRGGQGGKGAAGRKALRQHLLPHLQRQAQARYSSHEVLTACTASIQP